MHEHEYIKGVTGVIEYNGKEKIVNKRQRQDRKGLAPMTVNIRQD